MKQPTSACSQYGVAYKVYIIYKPIRNLRISGQGKGRTHFLRLGQDFLSGQTFIPRQICPVGQNILGRCVPRTRIPADTLSHNIGLIFNHILLDNTKINFKAVGHSFEDSWCSEDSTSVKIHFWPYIFAIQMSSLKIFTHLTKKNQPFATL